MGFLLIVAGVIGELIPSYFHGQSQVAAVLIAVGFSCLVLQILTTKHAYRVYKRESARMRSDFFGSY